MVDITIDADIQVYCGVCGKGICHLVDCGRDSAGRTYMNVDPCPDCLQSASEEAYNEGEAEARRVMEESE